MAELRKSERSYVEKVKQEALNQEEHIQVNIGMSSD
jgi:hypothetical protein